MEICFRRLFCRGVSLSSVVFVIYLITGVGVYLSPRLFQNYHQEPMDLSAAKLAVFQCFLALCKHYHLQM